MIAKDWGKKRGRKPKEDGYSRKMFTRTTEDVGEKLDDLARFHRVSLAELLRWLCEDAAAGQWKPSHLR